MFKYFQMIKKIEKIIFSGGNKMLRKILGIIICMLMIFTAALSTTTVAQTTSINLKEKIDNLPDSDGVSLFNPTDGWTLQWSHAYGGNGHAQMAQPVGDIDGDGINEVIVGGYENSGICRILSYNSTQKTYVQEYSWVVPGGSYHSPSGACIADLDKDGILELCVSWGYSGADGVYAYHWDGTTLTQLDYYHGTGVDFVFDIYACDYNDDGNTEVLIANAPNMGTGPYHVTALGWSSGHFVWQTSWSCPGGSSMECPMVWSGDVDNDGLTEVIADVSSGTSSTAGTWALNWNTNTQSWDAVNVWSNYAGATVYGDSIGDINGDGTPEIGIGSYGGTPQGWLFEWDGSAFQKVWNGQYPGGQPVIEAVAIGDADNDGHNEFIVGAGHVHVIGWNGSGYTEEATFTEPTGMLAGMIIGDTDTDGQNEVKGCEILSGTGTEFIWKHPELIPPVTTCTLDGEMNGSVYISDVTVTLNATDVGSGVNYTIYKLDSNAWTQYSAPFVVTGNGAHTVDYYSVDKAGNIEATKNCTFTIQHPAPPSITITIKGGLGVSATIKNTGTTNLTNVSWRFALDGKLVFVGKSRNGTIPTLAAGKETKVRDFVFGFGKTNIAVSAGDTEANATGTVILFFVVGVR
jgi:hypothetical protein